LSSQAVSECKASNSGFEFKIKLLAAADEGLLITLASVVTVLVMLKVVLVVAVVVAGMCVVSTDTVVTVLVAGEKCLSALLMEDGPVAAYEVTLVTFLLVPVVISSREFDLVINVIGLLLVEIIGLADGTGL